ncbi:hypothetical protein SG09_78490 [Bradyrhizobium ottawaense]|nr:hypothetical protein SG09_78490 [Bradyrhizobium ottawaense]GMO42360.1 hypothetical protein BwSF21_54660 [Bradyrhizobium ottawaense]GMO58078.1 hypothetical protein BwSF12_75110 [Bradyrhizobium ottawaense]GMO76046.1 hypothetical protein BwSG20_48510 [Bradyrhizobium ottawaense]GMO88405.1 hypothetical protein BwSH17_74090 [Bradyrhizobium ottawaense]
MRASTSVWGGEYNPIIPVFKRPPKEWTPEIYQRFKGAEVAKGYTRFFEPDVYVEAERGLLEEAGLGALRREHTIHPSVMTLDAFLEPERGRNSGEPRFGLRMLDVLRHIYKTEQQFVLRETRDKVLVAPDRANASVEAMFGLYPTASSTKYLRQAYIDAYRPDKVKPSPDIWRRVFLKGAQTPLSATRYGLKPERYWHHDLLLYVFNSKHATDLIDLWNLRLEPHPILPIPLEWFEELADDIHAILKAQHRPVAGNPNGVMHNATIEFGRSIPKNTAEALIRVLKSDHLPPGAVAVKYWRNAIWVEHRDEYVHRDQRLKVTAAEKRADLTIKDDGDLRTTFEPITPEFADRHGGGDHRWVNVLKVSNFGRRDIATVLPFNTFNREWPRLGSGGEQIPVGIEGWVFPQRYKNLNQYVSLMDTNDAIVGALGQLGIKAELSEPGHIARQMLENLGGLWGVHFLADLPTIELLKKMAGGLRRKNKDDDTLEENFGLRTAPLQDWISLLAARKTRNSFSQENLEDYTKRNVIRLGLETDCPHCRAKNWSTLTEVDYRITCERCLKPYEFPQAHLRPQNRNFTYRVIGPFSVPDYGRGSYSALLTLRLLDRFHSSMAHMTFSTAMNLSADNLKCEVDFIAWRADDRLSDRQHPPTLIIGEAKSLGKGELLKQKDLVKLKAIASRLPNAVLVIAVLRDHFTAAEKKLLVPFVNWGRRVNVHGEPTNPVLLLTANELMMEHYVSSTWEGLGGVHGKFKDHEHTRNLLNFADATQQIYLGMKSFRQERDEYWKKRLARRAAKGKVASH